MPLDPNHIHAEVPHARTVHLASQGWRPLPHHVQVIFNLVYGTDKEAEKLFKALREK